MTRLGDGLGADEGRDASELVGAHEDVVLQALDIELRVEERLTRRWQLAWRGSGPGGAGRRVVGADGRGRGECGRARRRSGRGRKRRRRGRQDAALVISRAESTKAETVRKEYNKLMIIKTQILFQYA